MRVKEVSRRRRRNRVLKLAKGFRGRRKNGNKRANQAVELALDSCHPRPTRPQARLSQFLITRKINAAARELGLSYSRLMERLTKAGVEIDRKIMADLAVRDPRGFEAIAAVAKGA